MGFEPVHPKSKVFSFILKLTHAYGCSTNNLPMASRSNSKVASETKKNGVITA